MKKGTVAAAPRNVEIKAQAADWRGQLRRAEALAGPATVLEQEDVFFACPHGRLKLRLEAEGTQPRAELIYYERPDATGPTPSAYARCAVGDGAALRALLGRALGVRATVRKRRRLFRRGRARIHFDEVEGLGRFIEVEVVLAPGEADEAAAAEAAELMERLAVRPGDRVGGAYADLLRDADGQPPGRAGPPTAAGTAAGSGGSLPSPSREPGGLPPVRPRG